MHEIRNKQGALTDDDFWDQYGGETPRMALLMKITSRASFGSEVIGLTSNSRDMTMPEHPGVTFKATPAITPTTVEMALDEATNLEMTGIYNADSFDQTEVLAGKWDFAEIEIFVACWDNTDLGEFVVFKGNLGEFKDYQTYFTAEARGPIARLSNNVNVVTARLCRVKEFGDAECGKDLDGTVTIDSETYNIRESGLAALFGDSAGIIVLNSEFAGEPPLSGFYRNGKILFTTGLNAGISREIADSGNNTLDGNTTISFKRRIPFAIAEGDEFTLTAGCDRTIENCMLYENVINRRAEDYVPGVETANRVPSAN